jgi:hypothetical protein
LVMAFSPGDAARLERVGALLNAYAMIVLWSFAAEYEAAHIGLLRNWAVVPATSESIQWRPTSATRTVI